MVLMLAYLAGSMRTNRLSSLIRQVFFIHNVPIRIFRRSLQTLASRFRTQPSPACDTKSSPSTLIFQFFSGNSLGRTRHVSVYPSSPSSMISWTTYGIWCHTPASVICTHVYLRLCTSSELYWSVEMSELKENLSPILYKYLLTSYSLNGSGVRYMDWKIKIIDYRYIHRYIFLQGALV